MLLHIVTPNCILLAHWKSQSYFQENYTDLYDFCFCLSDFCGEFSKGFGGIGGRTPVEGTSAGGGSRGTMVQDPAY